MKNPPIIIIGAGRSGTNMLRDSICNLEGVETWPCDEINYIWRHGNITMATDRFTEKEARPEVSKFIKKQFEKFEKESNADYVVEKTCASSLKVPFINEIFPEAKFVLIVRDGHDVASSAAKRWTASLELKYIWKKVKYVPVSDIPYYGFRYFVNRVKKMFSKEKRLAYWGPLYPGMIKDLMDKSLIEVCARQWSECVEYAHSDLSKIDSSRVYKLKYEDFVSKPAEELEKVLGFLNINATQGEIENAVSKVSVRSVGNYKKHLDKEAIEKLERTVAPVMQSVYGKM